MPRKALDKDKIQYELLAYLNRHGASPTQSLCQKFQISQPTLSRIISSIKNQILVLGKAQETKYALCRKIENTITPIPLYEIHEDGSSKQLGILHALEPHGFYFESKIPGTKSSLYRDLPYFLNDIRPAGFLGRLIPAQNKDLHLPNDVTRWNPEHCLTYLSCREWNSIGNYILGEKSFQLYLENCQLLKQSINSTQREEQYSQLANDALLLADLGSSAGGEQPKFTTILLPEMKHVLVKFSPPTNTEIGKRVGDLMICEHLALQILKKNSYDASESKIIMHDHRFFLEVKRFDRMNKFGRRGLISLGSLDAEFTGKLGSWSQTAAELIKKKIIPSQLLTQIRWLELFGELIANNDMHLYNLSFFTCGLKVTGLAPVYDMLPMLFMPRNNQIIHKQFAPPLPLPEDGKIWSSVSTVALEFWDEVLSNTRISTSFKKIAQECKNKITELKDLAKLLPKN